MSQLEAPTEPHVVLPDCPYVGLRDYTESDAELFFGRDAERRRIIGNLRAARLTLLYAQSGVGKSSLLRAGVVPRIRRAPGVTRYLPVVFSSWSGEPVAAVIGAVGDAVEAELPSVADLGDGSLFDALQRASELTGATLLVILDQFEELFLYHGTDGRREAFAEQLARCINDAALGAHFLISIREDAYASIGDLLNGLVPNVYGNFLHLDYLDRDDAKDAIERPVERFNELHAGGSPIVITPGLVDAVLDQIRRGEVVASDTAALDLRGTAADGAARIETTYLQLVMKRLWDEEMAAGSRALRVETLERLGGASTIIATHLDQSMAALPEDQQTVAANVFRYLVTSAGTKIALTIEDVAELSGLPVESVAATLRRLAAPDLHILRPVVLRDAPDRARYEIFHDALARPILDWRTRFTRRQRDAEQAAELERERVQREEAQAAAKAAEEREARERRRKLLAFAGLAVAVVALLVTATAFAIAQKRDADRQKRAAAERADFAQSVDSARWVEQLSGSPVFGPDAAALASLEVTRLSNSFAARDLALSFLQAYVAQPSIGAGHRRQVNAAVFVTDSVLATGSADATIRLWDEHGNQIGDPLTTGERNAIVGALALRTHGGTKLLAAGRGDGYVEFWDVTEPEAPKLATHLTATVSAALVGERPLGSAPTADAPAGSLQVPGGGNVLALAFSANGAVLAAASGEQVTFYGMEGDGDPELLGTVDGLGFVYDLAFDPNGDRILVATDEGVVELAGPSFATAEPDWLETGLVAYSVAIAPDGTAAFGFEQNRNQQLAFSGEFGFRTMTVAVVGGIEDLEFGPTGSVLISGGYDSSVTTWDVATGREFGPPRQEEGGWPIHAVAISPDGSRIAGAGEARFVKVWDTDPVAPLATTIGSVAPSDLAQFGQPEIVELAYGTGGHVAAAATYAGALVWSDDAIEEGSFEPSTRIPYDETGWAGGVAFLDDDVLVVGNGNFGDGGLTLWDLGSSCTTMPDEACMLDRVTSLDAGILSLALDPAGDRIATGDADGFVELWDVSDPESVESTARFQAGERQIFELEFSPDGAILAAGGNDGTISMWRVQDDGAERFGNPIIGHERQPVSALAFSPDGTMLASGGLDQVVVLWSVDPSDDQPLRRQTRGRLFSQTNSILALSFSPDGRVLAAGDGDGSTCLYNVASREAIGGAACLTQHFSRSNRSSIVALAFLPDGSGLLSAGRSNPVVRWDSILWLEPDDDASLARLGEQICQLARRNLSEGEWNDAFAGTVLEDQRHATCPEYPLP
jgi:WD40 repeat protein